MISHRNNSSQKAVEFKVLNKLSAKNSILSEDIFEKLRLNKDIPMQTKTKVFVASRIALQEILKEFHQAERKWHEGIIKNVHTGRNEDTKWKNEIIQGMFFNHNGVKLEINNNKNLENT